MIRVSTKPIALLATVLLLGTIAYGQNQNWPLKRTIDLSSGFGDFRANRFHAGVDLRTGGKIGVKVYSPVDGYVWRVKMSYRGYGKGLYVKGTDDHFYVFGHLSRFNDAIESAVRRDQFQRERYYTDIYFPEDSVPVRKGQLIGYSGQTGVGAPHLHFEIRSPDNVPLDPLSHGFTLDDKTPPTFDRIGFHLQDDYSLFPNGRRKLFLPVRKVGEGKYVLDSVLYLNAPFGVLADCYDQKRAGGMRQAIHKLTLSIDGVPYYESVLDSLPFEIGPVVSLVFDPMEAANEEKRVRRLYRPIDNEAIKSAARAAYSGALPGRCAYGSESPARQGEHLVLVTAEDAAGNRSELTFRFFYVEGDSLRSLSVQTDFGVTGNGSLEIADYRVTENGLVTCVLDGEATKYYFFRPLVPIESSVSIQDLVMLLHQGRLLDSGIFVDVVGWHRESVLLCDSQMFSITLPLSAAYGARFLGVTREASPDSLKPLLASEIYKVQPEAFPVRKEFEVSIKLDPGASTNPYTGLCWYDKKEKEWVWIDEDTTNADLAAGPSLGGGLFAALIDTTAPTITGLNLKRGHKYWNRQPPVKFVLEDNLSGFEDDLSIDVRIDGKWLLPELDIESGDFVASLRGPLDLGKHELTITIVDRAGNRTEQQVEFDVVKR